MDERARSPRRTHPAGLDHPGIGPSTPGLNDIGRVKYLSATDAEALEAFQLCCKLEGIIPALEPSHALARVIEFAPKRPKDHLMVVCMSGRATRTSSPSPSIWELDGVPHQPALRRRQSGRARLVTFVTGGDPDHETSAAIPEGFPPPAPT